MSPRPPRRSLPLASTATVSVLVLAMVTACATDDAAARRDSVVASSEEAYKASHAASAPPDTTAALAAARAPAPMTDNNILARVAQDDRLEVQVAGIAIGKITSPALKDFARQIRDNHSAGESDARKLSQALKIPEQPAATDTTKAHQQALVATFTKLPKGKAFDTTYVRHLVDGHTAMLRDIRVMEGKATHAEVKKLLAAAAPEVQRHLTRAREIGKALTAAPASKPAT
jgi:putative membrane protein